MKNKKKVIISIIAIIVVLGVIAGSLALYFTRYSRDKNDTEELFRENVAKVGYENTIEDAIPQTALYDVIVNHYNSPLPDGKTEKKAIIIGYDGCHADVLTEKQDNGAINALLKDGASIRLAYCGGVNYPAENTQKTSTAPGWCSIVTGVWADVHGITGNDITKSLDTKSLMLNLVENGTIDSSAFYTRWKGHFSRDNATYLEENEYAEGKGLNVGFNLCDNDEATHEAALNAVRDESCADFTFIIYEHTDSTGHNYGFTYNNPGYKEAFVQEDLCGYEVIEAIRARDTYDT
ncbi:MAG: alkaline phosphatase family protein, partial [Clostridia bacterium]|nr:alkaline phosphatase family protein [Clostridia bacterium]